MSEEGMRQEPVVELRVTNDADEKRSFDVMWGEKVVGSMRITEDVESREITLLNYTVQEEGKGLGTATLRALIRTYPDWSMTASVEASNMKSIRALMKVGFTKIHTAGNTLTYRLERVE